ncbi:MAG: T9SS type A sorting domain-containing protein [Ignavibacteria bacterium]|nr:T9SS type A sorting domain-containing protein [Ignavibacteria bacterium]MBT8380967.1 T9SS type A sorting domain-containing protein [Ignavibacteria bacterium]MBT8392351.1 T9SS type A sorting domain-containing protein [Ignavibacteria bacterium]NNJ53103.1 T9SS type A sorting domain-containing protein [Ignavibacteriaceae bacterium]NNL22225.1 T9SS type A sorting domain-containing protein [Ignavibacteriaceae bacterium]
MNQPYSGSSYCSDHLGVLTYLKDGVLDVDAESSVYPDEFKLFQNYPNPFNPETMIEYTVPSIVSNITAFVQLKVYDSLGNEIATLVNEDKSAGNYEVRFDGTSLPSGIYFYKLIAGNYSETKKMMLIK